jgi:hypothetical protein
MGAPVGNQNAAKSRAFYGALQRAIAQDDGKRLRDAAEKLLDLAAQGEAWAVKELADRLDGKSAQSVTVAGDPENPLAIQKIERVILNAKNAQSTDA